MPTGSGTDGDHSALQTVNHYNQVGQQQAGQQIAQQQVGQDQAALREGQQRSGQINSRAAIFNQMPTAQYFNHTSMTATNIPNVDMVVKAEDQRFIREQKLDKWFHDNVSRQAGTRTDKGGSNLANAINGNDKELGTLSETERTHFINKGIETWSSPERFRLGQPKEVNHSSIRTNIHNFYNKVEDPKAKQQILDGYTKAAKDGLERDNLRSASNEHSNTNARGRATETFAEVVLLNDPKRVSEFKGHESALAQRFQAGHVNRPGILNKLHTVDPKQSSALVEQMRLHPPSNNLLTPGVHDVFSDKNIHELSKTADQRGKLTYQSEKVTGHVRVLKRAAVGLSSEIKVYSYPNGTAQIEISGSFKLSTGAAVETNIIDTHKGKTRPGQSNDKTYMFAEMIANAGGEGSFSRRLYIPNDGDVTGSQRAEQFLDKLEKEHSAGRFVPWVFGDAAQKEFQSTWSGHNTKGGVFASTKLYGSMSLLNPDNSKVPQQLSDRFREDAKMQSVRAYGEANGAFKLEFVHNYNNPEAAHTEHADQSNVQTTYYHGFSVGFEGGAKGISSIGGYPIDGGRSYEWKQSYGIAGQFDAIVSTYEYTSSEHMPNVFFDGRLNQGKDLGHSKQTTFEDTASKYFQIRQRTITSFSDAKSLAKAVNERDLENKPITEKLQLMKDHLPNGFDQETARSGIEGAFGHPISDEDWNNFLEKQLDDYQLNNLDYIGTLRGRPHAKSWNENRSSWKVTLNNWRKDNNINALEQAYQTHWPDTRTELASEFNKKIEQSDFAEVSADLREKRVLTPGTTIYSVFEGTSHKGQFSIGQSFPGKGVVKATGLIETEESKRLALFTVSNDVKDNFINDIMRSGDQDLINAYMDIYNAQQYPTIDTTGKPNFLRPIYSGDPRHIKDIITQTGGTPKYGNSVYVVKDSDLNSSEPINTTLERVLTNGTAQFITQLPNDFNWDKYMDRFKAVNFPGASEQQIKEMLEAGIPLMMMNPKYY